MREWTAFLKLMRELAMTRSMGLKFLLQRKHLARLVLGWTAELNSEQMGQRNRR